MNYAELVQKHGSIARAAKALKISPSTFRDRMRGGRAGLRARRQGKPASTPAAAPKAYSLDDFRTQFDKSTIVPNKIRAALSALGDGWLYEVEFAQHAGVSLNDLGRFRDAFASHQIVARAPGRSERRIWVGSKKVADRMREML